MYTYIYTPCFPPDPMNHVKIFKGPLHQYALWELVPNWYKSFSPDHFGQAEMKDSNMLTKKSVPRKGTYIIICTL